MNWASMMEHTYWHKQQPNKPLFPDLIWSRPETKHTAGKLLIIGGNLHGFSAPASAYNHATKAGIGTVRVLLPDALQKTVGSLLPGANFAPSTRSGSFAQVALAELLSESQWADGVLVAGDLARNSETAILLEKFADKYSGAVTLTRDSVDYFKNTPATILERTGTTLVITIAQLQQLAVAACYPKAFTFDMGLIKLVETLHDFTDKYQANIVLRHLGNVYVAVKGQVSTTQVDNTEEDMWRTETGAHTAVWWLQNPTKQFEALTSSVANL